SVPAWLAERFEGLDHDSATRKLIAAAVGGEEGGGLVDRGGTKFHFYTMNRADPVYAVCHLLGLRAPGKQAAGPSCPPSPAPAPELYSSPSCASAFSCSTARWAQ